jgi:hypothetical protein
MTVRMLVCLAFLAMLIASRISNPPTPATAPGVGGPVVAHLSTACSAGYVCGTCPNGDSWSYLNDGSTDARWAQQTNLIFDTAHPCG